MGRNICWYRTINEEKCEVAVGTLWDNSTRTVSLVCSTRAWVIKDVTSTFPSSKPHNGGTSKFWWVNNQWSKLGRQFIDGLAAFIISENHYFPPSFFILLICKSILSWCYSWNTVWIATLNAAYYHFTQQSLPACKPVLTPTWVSFWMLPDLTRKSFVIFHYASIIMDLKCWLCLLQVITVFLLMGVLFIPVGLVVLHTSRSVSVLYRSWILIFNFIINTSVYSKMETCLETHGASVGGAMWG